MSELIEIGIRRGRLQERIARQRAELGGQLRPLRDALASTDRAVALVDAGVAGIRRHPSLVLAAFVVLALLKPRRVWRWGRRAFFVWRTWRVLRGRIEALIPQGGR
jgi:hypothetical protein